VDGIDEPIVVGRRQNGRNDQYRCFRVQDKLIPDAADLRWSRVMGPVRRKIPGPYGNAANAVRNLSLCQHQVVRQTIRVKMSQVFEHGEREAFRRIDNAGTGVRPTATETKTSLPVKRVGRENQTCETVHTR